MKKMKEIKLSQGEVALVDDEDYERVNQHKWTLSTKQNGLYAYRNIRENKKRVGSQYLQHFILETKEEVDHRDCNGLNNQKYNLRICTHKENQRNRRPQKNCSSQYKGVNIDLKYSKKYRAQIKPNDKMIHLGYS